MSAEYEACTVVIPARNEAATLPGLIAALRACGRVDTVLVVNDGSTDDTAAVARAAGAQVINHLYSRGNGAAVKSGARAVRTPIALFMDADGQHQPQDVPRLLDELALGHDMVVGARTEGSQANWWRGIGNRIYNRMAAYVTARPVKDLTSGFRAVRMARFREFLYLLPNGFSYPTTSTMAFFRAGYSVSWVPIHAPPRQGDSHLHPVKDGVRFLMIIFRVGTLYSPLKFFFPVSVMLFLLASGYYGWTYTNFNRFTNMSALLYLSSVLVFALGLLSEQISALQFTRQAQLELAGGTQGREHNDKHGDGHASEHVNQPGDPLIGDQEVRRGSGAAGLLADASSPDNGSGRTSPRTMTTAADLPQTQDPLRTPGSQV